VEVKTGIAGFLALYRMDAAGNSTRVYPAGDAAAQVLPNLEIRIPGYPLAIAGGNERLRLVVVPVPLSAVNGALGTVGGFVDNKVLPVQGPLAPLVVDIPLAPN
jgi:hypothetical protein